MGDRRPPEGYVEIARWTLKRASVKERLLSVLVGLVAFFASLSATAFIVGTATGSGEVTIGGGTFFTGMLVGLVLGVILHEAVHGVFFLVFRRLAALWVQAVDQFRAGLLRGRPRGLPRQASVPRRRVGPGSAVDRGAGSSAGSRGCEPPSHRYRHMGLCAQRRGLGGRHAHDAQGDVLPPRNPFRRHRGRVRSLWSNRQPGIAIGNVVVAYNSWTRIAPARRRASLDAGRRSLSCDISALNKRSLPNC